MNDIYLNFNQEKILKQVASNLGMTDLTDGSYLKNLIYSLSDFGHKAAEEANKSISNLYLESAEEYVLENYGNNKNLPRAKSRELVVHEEDMAISITPKFFTQLDRSSLNLFASGETITSDIFTITFLSNVKYKAGLDRVYVSCMININPDYRVSLTHLNQYQVLKLKVPKIHENTIESLELTLEKSLYFSNFTETLDAYRNRLILASRAENISNEDVVKATIKSVPFIDQFYINNDVYPHDVYVMNNDMYTKFDGDETIKNLGITAASSLVDRIRSYGSAFEFKKAEKVGISVDIRGENLDENDRRIVSNIPIYFYDTHTLGSSLSYSDTELINFLQRSYGLEKKIEVTFYYYFNGIKVTTPDPKLVEIKKHQYPYIVNMTFNGDIIDV